MVTFKSFKEYDKWADKQNGEAVLIDDGWQMSMDMTVDAHSAVGAVEEFTKVFLMPETRLLLRDMKAEVEDGTFEDCVKRLNPTRTRELWENIGGYNWAVENIDENRWYVFLNATGNFLGRVKGA